MTSALFRAPVFQIRRSSRFWSKLIASDKIFIIPRRSVARLLDEPVKRVRFAKKPTWKLEARSETVQTAQTAQRIKVKDDRFRGEAGDGEFDEEEPPIQREIVEILDTMDADRRLSLKDCKKLRQETIEKCPNPAVMESHVRSVDSNILSALWKTDRFFAAVSYLDFLFANGFFNPGCVLPASSILRDRFGENYSDGLAGEENRLIDDLAIKIHENVVGKFPKALVRTLEHSSMAALACSSRWTEALDWLKGKEHSEKYRSIFMPLIVKLIENDQPSRAFRLFKKLLDSPGKVETKILVVFWKYAALLVNQKNDRGALDVVNELVDLSQSSRIRDPSLPLEIVPYMGKLFSSPKFAVERSKISGDGRCTRCDEILQKMSLSDVEFDSLRKEVMERLVGGISIYRWTTPRERVTFERLLVKNGPFDIVVDGLNVVHVAFGRLAGLGRLERLASLLECLKDKKGPSSKILLLLRPYVKFERFGAIARRILDAATVFKCESLSEDDSYLLFAALFSGKNCYIVTNDLLRSQNQLLTAKGSVLFQTWRRARQVVLDFDGRANASPVWPSEYAVYPQRNDRCYHFPLSTDVEEVGTRFNFQAHEEARDWLCIRKKVA